MPMRVSIAFFACIYSTTALAESLHCEAADGESCETGTEQAAMVQGLARNRLAVGKARSTLRASPASEAEGEGEGKAGPLLQLLESSERMFREGATPDVVAFAKDTLQQIKEDVLPAIRSAHESEKALLETQFGEITAVLTAHQSRLGDLAAAVQLEVDASAVHKECRGVEQKVCNTSTACDKELKVRSSRVDSREAAIGRAGDDIKGKWCPTGSNNSELTFRRVAARQFQKYKERRVEVKEAWLSYHEQVPICEEARERLEKRVGVCNAAQQRLEQRSCRAAFLARHAQQRLNSAWRQATHLYLMTVASAHRSMNDRKGEETALQTVDCLIEKIVERGGEPCSEEQEPGVANETIQSCHHLDVDTSHLDIDFRSLPAKPKAVEVLAKPCGGEFRAREYKGFGDCVALAKCVPCPDDSAYLDESGEVVIDEVDDVVTVDELAGSEEDEGVVDEVDDVVTVDEGAVSEEEEPVIAENNDFAVEIDDYGEDQIDQAENQSEAVEVEESMTEDESEITQTEEEAQQVYDEEEDDANEEEEDGDESQMLLKPGTTVSFIGGKDGKYCSDEGWTIQCNREQIEDWEKFVVVDAGGGKIALLGGKDNKYCSDELGAVKCNRDSIQLWEQFTVVDAGDGKIALRGGHSHLFCSDEGWTTRCNRRKLDDWEKFKVLVHED